MTVSSGATFGARVLDPAGLFEEVRHSVVLGDGVDVGAAA